MLSSVMLIVPDTCRSQLEATDNPGKFAFQTQSGDIHTAATCWLSDRRHFTTKKTVTQRFPGSDGWFGNMLQSQCGN